MTSLRRLRAAWRALPAEHRVGGAAAIALLMTMLLPWYTTSAPMRLGKRVALAQDTQTALQAFSWVEAAALLVALGVLGLLFARGERRAFHLPGGDGTVIAAAGVWVAALIVWRLFDRPSLGQGVSVGLAWGIFVALAAAAALAAAGNRVRAAHRPEPPLDRAGPPHPANEPFEIHLPERRPHLEETGVLPRGERGRPPPPLSRASAARDTADVRPAPAPDPEVTEPLPREDAEPTRPLKRRDAGEGDQPKLPGL
jgi:hypothetical protein